MTSPFPVDLHTIPPQIPGFMSSQCPCATTPDRTGFLPPRLRRLAASRGCFSPKSDRTAAASLIYLKRFWKKKRALPLSSLQAQGLYIQKIDLLNLIDCWFIEILTHSVLSYYVYFLSTGEYNSPHLCLYGFGHCSLQTNDGSIDGFSCSLVDEARSVSDCGWKKSIYSNQLT